MFSNKKIRDKDFYYQDIPKAAVGDTFSLNEDNTHHNAVVLRRKAGDNIVIINGRGQACLCSILSIAKRSCLVKIEEIEFENKRPHAIYIGIGLTKNKSRNEWIYEKCTEIGIDGMMTLNSFHAETEKLNVSRMTSIFSAAMIQSKNLYLPQLHISLKPSEAIQLFKNEYPDGQVLIAHCEDDKKNHILNELKKEMNYLILIGPEGDFSSEEIRECTDNGAIPVSLGSKRLRTETAAVYAVTIFNAINYE